MKNKIVESLKSKYGSLGFDAKAFDGVATFLENNITEEGQIDTFVEQAKTMLEAFNSEADRRSSATNKKLEELQSSFDSYKEKNPSTQDANGGDGTSLAPDENGKFSLEQVNKIVDTKVGNLEKMMNEKFGNQETATLQEKIREEAFTKLQANPLYQNDVNKVLMKDKFDGLDGTYKDVDEMLEAATAAYTPIVSKLGVSELPKTPSSGDEGKISDDQKAFINRQREDRGQELLKD